MQTRRDFLRIAGAGFAALASGTLTQSAYSAVSAPTQGIRSWVTSKSKKCAEGTALNWSTTAGGSLKSAVEVSLDKKQEVLGFGAAFTDAACYNFHQLSDSARANLFHELFSSEGLDLSVGRICIGSSDYAAKVYSYDEGEPDPEMKRFSIEHDNEYILPILKEARKVNPDLFLLASPWSPPGWMKPSNTMLGGNMNRKHLDAYAKYFVKFLKAYGGAGVPVQAVTVQNEVDTDQDGRMPACAWPQEIEMDFVRYNLGPALEKEGIKTKIWIIDHNYNLWGRAVDELEGDLMRKYVGGVAWHGYVGSPALMTRVHDRFPEVDMFWTEGGPDYTQPDYATDWVKWGSAFSGIMNNWCRCIIGWNLSLDEVGKPNIGPFPCGGLLTINSKSKEISHSGQYWALAHFSKFIKRGAKVLASKTDEANVHFLAAENPGGQKVLVATNAENTSKKVMLQFGKQSAELNLEPESISTFTWN